MNFLLLGFLIGMSIFLAFIRRHHRDALLQEYCRGVKDGIALGRASPATSSQGEGIPVIMSMN